MSSNTKVSFTLEPQVHIYKKRKQHVSQQENVYESNDESGSQTGRVQAFVTAPTPPPTPAPSSHSAPAPASAEAGAPITRPLPPPPLNLFPSSQLDQSSTASFSGQGLKISVPTPGAYRAPSASPPASLTPNTQAEIIREAREGIERERALRQVEEAIRQAAIGLASQAFQREDTPVEHLTPHSQRTPASIKSLRSPRIGLHLSPLQLSPMNQSPRVASEAPRVMLRPIAEKNSLSSISLDSLSLSNEGSFTSLNTLA